MTKRNRWAIWRAAQKIIVAVNLDPSEWVDASEEFWRQFCQRKYSLSYVQKIMRVVNAWGTLCCRKLGLPFLPVSGPRGYAQSRIHECFYSKGRSGSRESDPIKVADLDKASSKLSARHRNWISLSI